MFRNNTKLGLVAVFTVIGALPMAAQRPAGVGGPPSGTTGRPANADPAMRYEFIVGFLGLNETQKAQVKSIFAQSSSASDAFRAKWRAHGSTWKAL